MKGSINLLRMVKIFISVLLLQRNGAVSFYNIQDFSIMSNIV